MTYEVLDPTYDEEPHELVRAPRIGSLSAMTIGITPTANREPAGSSMPSLRICKARTTSRRLNGWSNQTTAHQQVMRSSTEQSSGTR